MNWRERLADWIAGGVLTRETERADLCRDLLHKSEDNRKNLFAEAMEWNGKAIEAREEAANIAAQRDEAIARAEVAENAKRAVEADLADERDAYAEVKYQHDRLFFALSDVERTARNITEARKIARQALGEAE